MTGFGEISPLWHNFKTIGQIFDAFVSIWKKFIPTLAKFYSYFGKILFLLWQKNYSIGQVFIVVDIQILQIV